MLWYILKTTNRSESPIRIMKKSRKTVNKPRLFLRKFYKYPDPLFPLEGTNFIVGGEEHRGLLCD